MPNTASQIESRVRAFADEIRALTRQELIDALTDVLAGAAPAKRGPGRPPKTSTPRTATASAPPSRRASRRRTTGGRRAPAEVAKTIERVRDYVVANPGKGAEQICPALGVTTRELAMPMKKLLASKHITRKGVRRATRYFPGPNATGSLPVPSASGRPKKK